MQCPSCWQHHYDPDFARCEPCRRIPVTSATLSQFKITRLTANTPSRRIKQVRSTTSVHMFGDPNAQISRKAVIPQITEEGVKILAPVETKELPSWMRGFVRVP